MKIAILGFGTVGSGYYEIMNQNKEKLKATFGVDVQWTKVLVRSPKKYRSLFSEDVLTTSFDDVLKAKPDVIIESMGGIEPTKSYVAQALEHGISVITANKDLMAAHGKVLLNLAAQHKVHLKFEASVGGGIPCITSLNNMLWGNEVTHIKAIINGTSNFILSKMFQENASYEAALSLAQSLGFAEANPEADVEGFDALRKIVLLSRLAYNFDVSLDDFTTQGITSITAEDLSYAKAHHAKIKLLALSQNENGKIYGHVKPTFISACSPFYLIDNEVNAVDFEATDYGSLFLSGKGAGKIPTGTSLFNDYLSLLNDSTPSLPCQWQSNYTLEDTYENACSFIIKCASDNINLLQRNLLDQFSDYNIKIDHINTHLLYAEIDIHSERLLKSKLEGVRAVLDVKFEIFHHLK